MKRSPSRAARMIRLAKFLDARAGRILVGLLARLRGPDPEPGDRPIRRILLIKFWGLGSIVLMEPAIRMLRRLHPHASIDFLTLEPNRDLFPLIPAVSRIWTLRLSSVCRFLMGSARLLPRLRRERYDLVIDAEFFANFSALLGGVTGAPQMVGFAQPASPKRRLLSRVVDFEESAHASQQFLKLVGASTASDLRPRLRRGRQRPVIPLCQPYIVLNINASALALERRWPLGNFRRLAERILEQESWSLVLIGAPGEAEFVGSFVRQLPASPRILNLCGKLQLPNLAGVLEQAAALISNDSGPVHLAAALQTPVVGLYGPETPLRYGPLIDRKAVLYLDLPCSPCMSLDNAKTIHCTHGQACMKGITVEAVHEALCGLLDESHDLPARVAGVKP